MGATRGACSKERLVPGLPISQHVLSLCKVLAASLSTEGEKVWD